jgi:hypothetical protein
MAFAPLSLFFFMTSVHVLLCCEKGCAILRKSARTKKIRERNGSAMNDVLTRGQKKISVTHKDGHVASMHRSSSH